MLSVAAIGSEVASDFWMSRTRTRLITTDGVTAFSSMDATETARQHIDTELEAMHIAFSLMQARRNRLSSIFLLEPNVLLKIFAYLAICDPPVWHDDRTDRFSGFALHTRPLKNPYSVIGWIRVTHVCRLWRDAALAETQLWTTVSSISPTWALEMMSRVRDMPFNLQVSFGRHGKTNDPVYGGILGQGRLAHLKTLTLYNHNYRQENALSLVEDLAAPAPLVESLSLSDWCEWWSDGCELPADLFGGAAPRLRSISLHHWTFASWDAPYLRDLTTLKVTFPENGRSDGTRTPTVLQILRVLKRMPRLQILVLESVLDPTFDDGLPRNHRPVPLAHLSRMRLRCEAAQCVFLMTGLTALPATARLCLSLTGPRQDLRDAIPLLKPFSMSTTAPHDPLIHVSLDCSKEYSRKMIKFVAASPSALGHQTGKIALFYHPPDVRWSAMLQRLFTELCLGEVEVLDLAGNELYRLAMKGFQGAFGPMKAVRELRLGKKAGRFSRNGGIVELIEALALPAPRPKTTGKKSRASTAEERDEPLLFPELDCLKLVSMNLASRKAEGETTYHEVLLEVLEARCTFGVPLQRLILNGCTYKQSWLATYGEYVADVSLEHPGRVLDENFQLPHSTQYLML